MLFLVGASLACEAALLSRFTPPEVPPSQLTVVTSSATFGGVSYTGAQVTFRSDSPVSAWQRVLEHPELQDEWHPKELGTERVERIEGTDFYQRTGISVLGTFTVRRQLIARVRWLEINNDLLHTCWYAGSPEEFHSKVAAWDEGSPWQEHGLGGWTIRNLPDGGSSVAYEVWVSADLVPSAFVAWAVSRTLPKLLNAFEERVGTLDHAAHVAGRNTPTSAAP